MAMLLVSAAPLLLSAQTLDRPAFTQPGAEELAAHAAIIFRGTVLAIEPAPVTAPNALPTIRIRFRVSEAFRGVEPGQELTISEWQGLWTTGERYRIGEDALLFLYPPATDSGLTSPVDGQSGHIVIPAAARRPDRDPRPIPPDAVASQVEPRQPAAADTKGGSTARRRINQP